MRFVAIPLLCLGIVFFFRTPGQETLTPGQKPEFRTSAASLYRTYYDNRPAADQKYQDKIVQVSGAVARVEQDVSGQVAVILQGSPARLSGIECLVQHPQIPQVRHLQPGQQVIVKGYGAGKKIHIRLRNCLLMHAHPASAIEVSPTGFSQQLAGDQPASARR